MFAFTANAWDLPEAHRQRLETDIEQAIDRGRRLQIGPPPASYARERFRNYARTNDIPFQAVVLLIQEAVEKEYDAVKNCVSTPDDDKSRMLEKRAFAAIDLLRYLNDPVSLPFLYRMSRKAEGFYRKVFEDMFYETVEKSPVAAIREVLDTDEKLAADASRLARALMNHVFEPKYTADELLQKMMPRIMEGLRNGEKYFQVDPEMMDRDPGERYAVDELLLTILPSIRDGETALRVDRNLCFRYPEYRTSVQRLVVCAFIEQCEPPVDWDEESRKPALAQKAELAELAATPPEQRTDMRQRFKNLPAPAAAQKEE